MFTAMKTKVILFLGAIALVTLSFTFAGVNKPAKAPVMKSTTETTSAQPAGGLYADVVE